LRARRVIAGDPPEAIDAVRELVGVVLLAERSLRLSIAYDDGRDENSGEILCRRGDAIVRHAKRHGRHSLARVDRSAVDTLLEAALDYHDVARSAEAAAFVVAEGELVELLELNAAHGASVAGVRCPALREYFEAMPDSRRTTWIEARS